MDIFEIQQFHWLWLLLVVPLLLMFLIYSWKQFSGFKNYWRQNPYLFEGRLPPWSLRVAKAVFCFVGLILIVVALTDPFYRFSVPEKLYRGVRFFFVVDVSLSMKGAEDVPPNRLLAAKEEIKNAVTNFDGRYELAIIPFAGEVNTYYYLPSFDQLSFLLALESLSDETVPIPGTNLAGALEAPRQLISELKSEKGDVNVVIILTDGGTEEGFAVNRLELSRLAGQLNASADLYIVGIGQLAPTPLVERDWGGNFKEYLRQPPANVKMAYSQLDEPLLRLIASSGNGHYFRFEQRDQLQAEIKKTIEEHRRFAKTEMVWKRRPLRSWLLFSAICALLLSLAELPRKRNTLR